MKKRKINRHNRYVGGQTSCMKIGVTIGDVAGVGPEVVRKALASRQVRRICQPVVIGDPRALRVKPGRVSKAAGEYALCCVRAAVTLAEQGEVQAVVTAPISKEGIHRAGYKFEGHTDYLAYLTKTRAYSMMLVSSQIRVVLVTIHTRLRDVARKISKAGVLRAIEHADLGCRLLGVKRPRVAVSALNPHGAEIGDEEKKFIEPALKQARRRKINVQGPFPADTLFYKVLHKQFDVVVAMYHDQGLIPLKMLGFEEGVNITVGLPIIRTSPDHGTAYDLVGKGIANPASMIRAIELAVQMAHEKKS